MAELIHEASLEQEPITTTVVEALKLAMNNLPDTQGLQEAFERGKNVDAAIRAARPEDLENNTLQLVRQLGFVAGHIEKRGEHA